MLVLSRKRGQSLRINGDIQVTVLDIMGETIKIGIDAPASVSIWREELYQEIAATNQQASAANRSFDDLNKTLKGLQSTGKGAS
ncbi:MAG: carbon storage regulator [Dethiosulfovibrio peptidovorans]|nr:MAG: carbon storage regulator [Dethiosulfovibrio peptidovorans]